jgi:ATP-dependent Lon protease
MEIARHYLVPKQLKESGLSAKLLRFSDDAIIKLINGYTREPGVRGLERQINAICRKIAHNKVKGERWSTMIAPEDVVALLGPVKNRHQNVRPKVMPGVVNGLAWTESGGDILQIEVSVVPGKGKLTITGKLGEVMNESAQAAMTYVRSRAALLQLDRDFYQAVDIHIHVPEGAIPKDGPSAGITMATALVSALLSREVDNTLAMTGEISLQGRVLPIGGLKEKLMAAVRSGVKVVLVPEKNIQDVAEVNPEIVEKLEVVPVEHMDEVLFRALGLDSIHCSQTVHDSQHAAPTGIVTH